MYKAIVIKYSFSRYENIDNNIYEQIQFTHKELANVWQYLQSGIDREASSCWVHTGDILAVMDFFQNQPLSVIPTVQRSVG